MSKATIKLDYHGIGEMLRGEEMERFVAEAGADRAKRAGSGYNFRTHNTGQRQAVNVYAETAEARADNLENNTLLKVLR